jgi:hypothetical protein
MIAAIRTPTIRISNMTYSYVKFMFANTTIKPIIFIRFWKDISRFDVIFTAPILGFRV